MGALTMNRKRGFDHYSPNCIQPPIHSPVSHNTHISKKPKISSFGDRTPPVSSQKGKSRVYLYPEPVNRIKREVHAPCRVTRFSSFGSRNGFRVVERGNFDGEMGSVLGSPYDLAKKVAISSLRFSKEQEEMIDVDELADGDIAMAEDADGDIEVVEVLENGVHEMEVELDDKDAGLDVENDMGVENNDERTTDLASLNKKLSLLGMPVHKQLWENAESRNPKLNSLSFQIELNEKRRAQLQLLRPVKQPEEEVVPEEVLREAFMPLSEDVKAEVSRAFSKSNSGKILASHDNSNITITGEVLQCLRPREWLNDEVINVYLELLKERERREPKKFLKCHFFNTFFYKKLISGSNGYDYKSVRRWTAQRKLGYALIDCEKIFVPIHQEIHWCLAVINKKDKRFQYLDSLGGTDSHALKALARYYVEEIKDKSGKDIDVSSWKLEYVKDLPAQRNGFDCGVFMVKYIDFYSRGLGLCFRQEDMPYFRLRTAKEILRLRAE